MTRRGSSGRAFEPSVRVGQGNSIRHLRRSQYPSLIVGPDTAMDRWEGDRDPWAGLLLMCRHCKWHWEDFEPLKSTRPGRLDEGLAIAFAVASYHLCAQPDMAVFETPAGGKPQLDDDDDGALVSLIDDGVTGEPGVWTTWSLRAVS